MADTRQFTDHNEIGGVNVYLEDKKLAESPEQNTVATTDYVLLKDTDGVPHKISKANMMSVVKDALADLLKNNDLGTSVTNVPALNASAFGSATVTNLASVLGATIGRTLPQNSSLNDVSETGVYVFGDTITETPFMYGVLVLLKSNIQGYDIQICINASDGKKFAMRTGIEQWFYIDYDIPSFYKNYNSLAELKAALAAI